jgi:cation transport ATPase
MWTLADAAAAQTGSEHPLAKAVLAKASGGALPKLLDFQSHTGRGLTANVDSIAAKQALDQNARFELYSGRPATQSDLCGATCDTQKMNERREGQLGIHVQRD